MSLHLKAASLRSQTSCILIYVGVIDEGLAGIVLLEFLAAVVALDNDNGCIGVIGVEVSVKVLLRHGSLVEASPNKYLL